MSPHLRYYNYILICFLFTTYSLFAQNDRLSGLAYIEKLIDTKDYNSARIELKKQITDFRNLDNHDTLVHYVKYVGSFSLADNDRDKALKEAEQFVSEIQKGSDLYSSKEALLQLALLYDDAGQPKRAYDITQESLELANNISDKTKADIETIQYNLGIRAKDFGDISLAKKHHFKALRLREANANKDYESFYSIYNAIGGMMWFSGKLDSAMYYYKHSLEALGNLEESPLNAHYRPALVKSNIGVLSQAVGKVDEGIEITREAISDIQKYLDVSEDESRKLRALKFKLSFVDNLGAFYHSVGEFKRADELIEYSYKEKLKFLKKDDPKIMISLILLGEAKMGLRDYEEAGEYLDQALEIITKNPNSQLYWHSAALISRASVYDELGDIENAKRLYEKGETLYRPQGVYTKDYLDEFIEMSLFYAKAGLREKAINLASESYNFIKKSSFKNTLQSFHHILNLAEVHYKLQNYTEALKYSNESLSFFIDNNLSGKASLDSIQIEYKKPKALLIKSKSRYNLNDKITEDFLKTLLVDIEKGIGTLERRRSIITSLDDLNLLMSEHTELFDFAKKLRLELFNITKNGAYLDKLITIHESSIYNRIRSRLNIKKNTAFIDIPEATVNKETELKENINSSLSNSANTIEDFFEASKSWNEFLNSLKQTYPKYYKMRYATIEESLDELQESIAENVTVIRYLFIDEQLYVLNIDKNEKAITPLNYEPVKNHIDLLGENQSDIEKTAILFHELYQQLWLPFKDKIATKKVIIIPDGPLFNLSFETLTPTKISRFSDLSTNSLLNEYIISYNYSLFLLNEGNKTVNNNNNFIAFAPEFNDKMKNDYKLRITDSISSDKTYLTLLPQPFSVNLAKQTAQLFGGAYFINEKASKQVFINNAKEHKIIHIGTHAESNNVSPELSRLIFAKDASGKDNSLYTFEIYNQNLSSDLAILTACETGKPTYQSGEGMISLAHAFNYAGSESILTSLWKIDEQSSTEIIKLFYNNLSNGLAKDEALRQAKLNYISKAEGRTISPQFWAGLVLIGDATPIELSSNQHWWLWVTIFIVLGVLLFLFLKKR